MPISQSQLDSFGETLEDLAMDKLGEIWRATEVNTSSGIQRTYTLNQSDVKAYMSPSMRRLEETDAPGAITNVGFWELGFRKDTNISEKDQFRVTNDLGQLEKYEIKAAFHSASQKMWLLCIALKVG